MAEKLILPDLAYTDEMFMNELSSEMERLTNQHNASPRVFVPAEIEEEIEQAIRDGHYSPEDEDIPSELTDALIVNLLTEDGLPYYTSALEHKAPRNHPFTNWVHQWTAEEGRHSPAIFAFIRHSRQVDMRWLESARMLTMAHPDTPQPGSLIEGIVYPAIQEPATEISHRNTINRLPDMHRRIGRKAISPVIGDENKHGIFYGSLAEAAYKFDTSATIIAIAKQIAGFAMPGKAIPGFDERKKAIDRADIFGMKQLRAIYSELLAKRWPIESATGLSSIAEKARDDIFRRLRLMDIKLERVARSSDKQATVSA
jgi:acyl-[acyl-carrier-protein] desaturase